MKSPKARLKEKWGHIMAMKDMEGSEMVEYLRAADIQDPVMWQQIALRVSGVVGRLPDDLHNRMMLESEGGLARRSYVEGLE